MRAVWMMGLVGCASVSEPFAESVPVDDITAVQATLERGEFLYEVGSETTFEVSGESQARASSGGKASDRAADNDWRIEARPPSLVIETSSPSLRSNVDIDVLGPSVMDLDVSVEAGSVIAVDVEGSHTIEAGRIQTTRLRGAVDVVSSGGGVDVEVYPWLDGFIRVDAVAGDVIVRVPFGGAYDVEILGDPDFELFVSELGFVGNIAQPGYFSGVTGDGSIPVRITVRGGSVQLLEAL